MLSRFILHLITVLMLIVSASIHADTTSNKPQAVKQALLDSERHRKLWVIGWSAFYGASIVANSYSASEADDPEDRYDARVSAATSTLGLIGTLWEEHRTPHHYQAAARQITTSGEYDLARAIARRQESAQSWQRRIPALAVNTIAGLVIGIGDDRPDDGAKQFALGMLVNEVKIRTRPTQVSDQMDGWQTVSIPVDQHQPLQLAFDWTLSGTGVTLRARF